MNEREPGARAWDIDAISQFLETPPEQTGDIAFGDGMRFRLGGAQDPTAVELFAGASVARITTPDTQVTLGRIEATAVQGGRLVFVRAPGGDGHRRAEMSAGGEILLMPGGIEWSGESGDETATADAMAEHRVREASLERAIGMLTDALDGCGGDDPECPDCGPARAFAADVLDRRVDPVEPVEAKRERLTVTGRIGAALSFRTTPNNVLIARFPVAVHRDDGGTTWETVVVFGEKAERLRGALEKGQMVQVVGYAHDREVPKRDGSHKTVHEIYAAVVRTR